MNLQILKMNNEHLKILTQNLQEYDEFWNTKILEDEFLNENSEYFVLVDNDEIRGFAGLWFNIDEAHIMNIAINRHYRRKHYGTNLLQYLIFYAQKQKKKCITLEVNEDNIPAIELYKKEKFEEVGRRKKYYNGKFDAIIMTKNF